MSIKNNTTSLQELLEAVNNLPNAGSGEQATPVISVNSSNGLITATAGNKSSTHQLAFQAAKTITPGLTTQIAVSSGYYTGGNIVVDTIPSQYVVPSGTLTISANGTHDVKNYASAVVNVESGGSGEQVEWSANEDAMVTGTLNSYFNDRVKTIRNYALYYCSSLTTASFPAATIIGNYAFGSCTHLTTISFPMVTTIGNGAFGYCYSLITASFPAATTIGNSAFVYCHSLITASFPAATTIGYDAFHGCYSLTTISFPMVTTIGISAFNGCYRLTTASFPAATTISNYAFWSCSSLTTASFPAATTIGNSAFNGCYSLTTISFPMVTTIGISAFNGCYRLTVISLPMCTNIKTQAFRGCSSLSTMYLTGNSVCEIANSYVFENAGITKTKGSIYVPASLLTSYQTATNWTYFSSRFVGI